MSTEQDEPKDKPEEEPPKPRPHIGTEIEKRGRDLGDLERKDRGEGN